MRKIKHAVTWFFVNVPLFLFSVSCIFPVIWLMYSSLKSSQEFAMSPMALPASPNFDNYVKAFLNARFDVYLVNSLFNSFVSLILVLILSFVTGYFLSRYAFPGRNAINIIFLLGILVPVHALMVPVFIQFKNLDFLNKWFTLLLPYVAFELPISIFLVDSFVRTVPREMEEAATIDGSGVFKTMFTIILPMCRPVLSTVTILTFMHVWNEFPFAQILVKDNALKTVPVGLTYFTTQYSVDYTLLMSALVMATLPVVIMYILFNKKIIQGMVAGAVKG